MATREHPRSRRKQIAVASGERARRAGRRSMMMIKERRRKGGDRKEAVRESAQPHCDRDPSPEDLAPYSPPGKKQSPGPSSGLNCLPSAHLIFGVHRMKSARFTVRRVFWTVLDSPEIHRDSGHSEFRRIGSHEHHLITPSSDSLGRDDDPPRCGVRKRWGS